MAIGIEHSGMDDDGLPEFRNETTEIKYNAFAKAFDQSVIDMVCKPLTPSIDIAKCFEQDIWRKQYELFFISRAINIWNTIDWAAWKLKPHAPKYNRALARDNALATIDNRFPIAERLPYDEIPLIGVLRPRIIEKIQSTNLPNLRSEADPAVWAKWAKWGDSKLYR